jgi:predicted nucleotidyltransferase
MEEKEKLESYASLYAKDLEAYAGAEMILLFGSLINSTTFNDIDVLFIAKDHEKVLRFCQELTVIRSKPFNPLIVSKTDVITALKQRKPAMVSAFQNGIVIKGEKTFIEVIAHARKKQG